MANRFVWSKNSIAYVDTEVTTKTYTTYSVPMDAPLNIAVFDSYQYDPVTKKYKFSHYNLGQSQASTLDWPYAGVVSIVGESDIDISPETGELFIADHPFLTTYWYREGSPTSELFTISITSSPWGGNPSGTFTGKKHQNVPAKGDFQSYVSSSNSAQYPSDGLSGNSCVSKRPPILSRTIPRRKIHQYQAV